MKRLPICPITATVYLSLRLDQERHRRPLADGELRLIDRTRQRYPDQTAKMERTIASWLEAPELARRLDAKVTRDLAEAGKRGAR